MLLFSFFITVFSSVCWLIYALMFANDKLGEHSLATQSSADMLMLIAIVVIPFLIIWTVFGYINQFLFNRGMNRKQNELLKQLQKNQDYTDLVVRVMLDAEHEIKDGFVLNKFDVFINDMNEALSEVIQRCNIASSAQLEQLWQRVRRGERWSLGKAVLEAAKNQSTFDAWAREKVQRDKVFRGSLLEFCSRYQNLLQLLEKHDRDRVFIRMIESGVFGKVYSIIAPLSEGISPLSADSQNSLSADTRQNNKDYSSVLKIASMEEPKIDENITNVDKNDDEQFSDDEMAEDGYAHTRSGFLSKLNPFRRHEPDTDFMSEADTDPFFRALHNSFRDENDNAEPSLSDVPSFDKPDFEIEKPALSAKTEKESSPVVTFGNSQKTLNSIRSEINAAPDISRNEPIFEDDAEKKSPAQNETDNDDDLVYPFGGWTDENKYNK